MGRARQIASAENMDRILLDASAASTDEGEHLLLDGSAASTMLVSLSTQRLSQLKLHQRVL